MVSACCGKTDAPSMKGTIRPASTTKREDNFLLIIVQHETTFSVAVDWNNLMYVDALTLAAVVDEWHVLLKGARIDTIIQPTEYAIAIQCYAPGAQGEGGRNRWLYLSAHPQFARAHVTALKPAKIASEPPPFVMLLRKYLEGTRIEAMRLPRWERIIEVIAGHRASPESNERVRYRLIIEIMGRLSNIILCDEQGIILGSLKRVGSEINRYRTIAPNVPYVPPPPQQRVVAGQALPKLEPTTVTAAQLQICASDEAESKQVKYWQLLVKHLLGFSPLIAREAVFRTTGNSGSPIEMDGQDDLWEKLAVNVRSLASMYDTHNWQPQLVERIEKENGQQASYVPVAFAPYVLEQYSGQPGMRIRESPSMNVLLDDYYARVEWQDALESLRAPIRKALQSQRERLLRRADFLQQQLATVEEANRYRLQAELLLAYQHEVQPGQTSVTLPNFFEGTGTEGEGEETLPSVTIPLDPRFDAVENANRLFNRYHKLRRGAALVPEQLEQNTAELATVEQLLADLMLADTAADIALVKAEVQAIGYMRGKQAQEQKTPKAGKKHGKGKPVLPGGGVPLHMQSRDGFTLLVGKNSRQNEEVTFRQASANDIWLHARGVPGAHVIIKAAGREVPRSTIEQAASLAAYYSQARGSTTVPVDYTLQRYVRHMKGGGPGMVVYEREKTIYVTPAMSKL